MAIKMVREPSDTPNINNIDDIVPMRYAYGNQNGYVIGKGNEISNTVSGLNFTVNSGRLVLQGVECDIDATGVTITIDNIATKRYYTVYLEVNLGLNTATIKDEYDTATYPTIDAGDDLTENTTGVARLPLYQFTATSGIIGEVNKVVESVKYVNQDFIKNVKVNDASKVNNLEIKQDENGVLKIGNIIIPQKILLWEGSIQGGETENLISPITDEMTKIEVIMSNNSYVSAIVSSQIDVVGEYLTYYSYNNSFIINDLAVRINKNTNSFTFNQPHYIEMRITDGEILDSGTFTGNLSQIYGIIE